MLRGTMTHDTTTVLTMRTVGVSGRGIRPPDRQRTNHPNTHYPQLLLRRFNRYSTISQTSNSSPPVSTDIPKTRMNHYITWFGLLYQKNSVIPQEKSNSASTWLSCIITEGRRSPTRKFFRLAGELLVSNIKVRLLEACIAVNGLYKPLLMQIWTG